MIRVGIVGVGTIGSELAKKCQTLFKDDVRLVGVVDVDQDKERLLRNKLKLKRKYSLNQLVKTCDLIIEAAGRASAYSIAKQALSSGKDVMLMSAGGIVNRSKDIYKLAAAHRCCVYLPSGAVTGLDGLKSGAIGKIDKVVLTTRKPPISFKNAPHIMKRRINLMTITDEHLLFEGSAEKAIVGFPQNINISATLSLAGLGPKKTKVKIFACPGLEHHIHEVAIDGEFGSIYTKTQNLPSKKNPKTSHLAILSAIATLKRILSNVKVGT